MEVPQELLAADYVLFYAQIHSFPEDNQLQCRLKVAARQLYWAAARKMDLQIDKLKLQLPVAKDTPKRKKWAPYQSTYWGFRAKDVDVLLHEAEFVKMEMPLKATETTPLCCPDDEAKIEGDNPCCCGCLQPETTAIGEAEEAAITDENADFICAPFIFKKKHMFFGGRDGSEFRLTGAQRIYLTYSRLQRIDIGLELRKAVRSDPELLGCPPSCMYCKSLRTWLDKEGLPDCTCWSRTFLPTPSPCTTRRRRDRRSGRRAAAAAAPAAASLEDADTKSDNGGGDSRDGWRLNLDLLRYQLSRSWDCCCRFQPLRLIRLYFGERLAFYYAWFGYIIWCLLFLTAIGLCFFVYGLANA
uniref:Anoctamin n=1 Tax=Macrostomum lignano TaxID=282301 RepID=A0A1I8FJ55_9PLAT